MSEDKRLTDITELTAVADSDLIYIVDVSDTTHGAAGTSKSSTLRNAVKAVQDKNVVTVTSTTYTSLITNDVILADDDTAGSAVTITLIAAASANKQILRIKKIGSSYNVVIDGNGSETIDGSTTITLTVQYEAVTLVSDGSNWFIL